MESETKKKLDESELANFTGSENWYQHWLGKCLYTDGVKDVADEAGAHWLIDEIAISQTRTKVRAEEFQVWVLKVDLENHTAVLSCDDGNDNTVFSEEDRVHRFSAARDRILLHGRHDSLADRILSKHMINAQLISYHSVHFSDKTGRNSARKELKLALSATVDEPIN